MTYQRHGENEDEDIKDTISDSKPKVHIYNSLTASLERRQIGPQICKVRAAREHKVGEESQAPERAKDNQNPDQPLHNRSHWGNKDTVVEEEEAELHECDCEAVHHFQRILHLLIVDDMSGTVLPNNLVA
jgi:hypothetical protein